jgi:hypothetical protein
LSPKPERKNNELSQTFSAVEEASRINSKQEEAIKSLKFSLYQAEEKIKRLEDDNIALREELATKEDQIRSEVATEMEVRLREARAKHHEKHEQLRSQIGQESKKEFAVSMDRAGNQLEELMDKVDECEKEMIRMNQEHNKEVSSLRQVIERLQERLRSEETKDKENDVCKTAEKKRTPMKKGRGEKPKEESEDEESEGENHNEAGDEAEDNASIEPIKFTLSVGKKKTTRRNLRPRRALRNTNNKA